MTHALHRRPLVPLALSMTLALTLSACSQDAPAEFEDTATQQQSAAEDTTQDTTEDAEGSPDTTAEAGESPDQGDEAQETDDVTSQSAAAAGVDPSTVGEPIATVSVPARVEGDPEATMDVSLYSLTRDGESLIGIYSFTVRSETGADAPEWIWDYLGGQAWRPHLIDTQNLTRHDVLRQGVTFAMTDYQGVKFRPGQTLFAYAAFAAPPADVTTMTASLVDGAAAVPEAPVQ